jgi:hypothetical protein
LIVEKCLGLNDLFALSDIRIVVKIKLSCSDNIPFFINQLQKTFFEAIWNFEVVYLILPDWRLFERVRKMLSLMLFLTDRQSNGYIVLAETASLPSNRCLLEPKIELVVLQLLELCFE